MILKSTWIFILCLCIYEKRKCTVRAYI